MENGQRGTGALSQLAYELSLNSLERQERVLYELRARTGTILAASALAASFLGVRATDGGPRVLAGLAITAFAASIGSGIYVLLPKPGLIFGLQGSALFEREFEDVTQIGETYRRLANLRYVLEFTFEEGASLKPEYEPRLRSEEHTSELQS